jgi:hypothetical protein
LGFFFVLLFANPFADFLGGRLTKPVAIHETARVYHNAERDIHLTAAVNSSDALICLSQVSCEVSSGLACPCLMIVGNLPANSTADKIHQIPSFFIPV